MRELFSGWLGAEFEKEIGIQTAYFRNVKSRKVQNFGKNDFWGGITLVQFKDIDTRNTVLESFRGNRIT